MIGTTTVCLKAWLTVTGIKPARFYNIRRKFQGMLLLNLLGYLSKIKKLANDASTCNVLNIRKSFIFIKNGPGENKEMLGFSLYLQRVWK